MVLGEKHNTCGCSHANSYHKSGSNLGESAHSIGRLKSNYSPFHAPHREPVSRRIPEGQILGTVPLEAAKAYPTRIFKDLQVQPRIAYADFNTHQEQNMLNIKFLPYGAKTAPHPQIVFFIKGNYHVETFGYNKTNPFNWSTWMEFHVDAKHLKQVIGAVLKAEHVLEAL